MGSSKFNLVVGVDVWRQALLQGIPGYGGCLVNVSGYIRSSPANIKVCVTLNGVVLAGSIGSTMTFLITLLSCVSCFCGGYFQWVYYAWSFSSSNIKLFVFITLLLKVINNMNQEGGGQHDDGG